MVIKNNENCDMVIKDKNALQYNVIFTNSHYSHKKWFYDLAWSIQKCLLLVWLHN